MVILKPTGKLPPQTPAPKLAAKYSPQELIDYDKAINLHLLDTELRNFALTLNADGSINSDACPYTLVDADSVPIEYGVVVDKSVSASAAFPDGFKRYDLCTGSSCLFAESGQSPRPSNFSAYTYESYIAIVVRGTDPAGFIKLCK